MIKIKRIYDKPSKEDDYRILVDRLWPRGISKKNARIDLWLKEIAPSDKLRKWFSHNVQKWPEFQKKYKQELRNKKELVKKIKKLAKEKKTITLLFSTKDVLHNNAIVLRDFFKKTL